MYGLTIRLIVHGCAISSVFHKVDSARVHSKITLPIWNNKLRHNVNSHQNKLESYLDVFDASKKNDISSIYTRIENVLYYHITSALYNRRVAGTLNTKHAIKLESQSI